MRTVSPREHLNFKVSTGLKSIIGRDLITNDLVAVFELVKNSFDAQATRVDIYIDDDNFYIIDNGKGMSHDDILEKWLFVAYSAKKDGSEDPDYREKISQKKAYAGSKGVGRFSCDRLGSHLRMQSKHLSNKSTVENIEVDWELFEENDKENFLVIPIENFQAKEFELPKGIKNLRHGTSLHITNLREQWDRPKLLTLKASLSKLINPFEGAHEKFEIHLHAPNEKSEDLNIKREYLDSDDPYSHRVVNGKVENFIFKTLGSKTTKLVVTITDEGHSIESKLIDRGELIFHIREPNPFPLLEISSFSCHLFYLNRSAKQTFSRRMGVNSISFGSVFLFKNGFRIFPIGEEGDDSFGIDRRHGQGYARTLGTRDLVGRIDVTGDDEQFKESSSRDQGLIITPAYEQLEECFWEKCLKRLERYIVGVAWRVSADKDSDDISKLTGDRSRARAVEMLTKLTNARSVQLIAYSKRLIGIIDEKSDDFEKTIDGLKQLATSTEDNNFLEKINKAEKRYLELKRSEQEALAAAEAEQAAREDAEKKAKEAAAELEKVEAEFAEEIKRNIFLRSVSTLDYDTILNLHHQIGIYSADINNIIANYIDKLNFGEKIGKKDLLSLFEQLLFRNKKILSISKFATKANFRLDAEEITEDIPNFFVEYVEEICPLYSGDGLVINIESDAVLSREFKPIELSMLIDNMIDNAKKAGSTEINFALSQITKDEISVTIQDDGFGFDRSLKDIGRIFEKGYTTTEGSGLGLYHARFIIDQLDGTIEIDPEWDEGAKFIIRIRS